MKNRFIMALALLLLNARWCFAQTTETAPAAAPPMTTSSTDIAAFLPARPGAAGGGQFWATGDYLLTFVRGTNLPVLVTTSDAGTPRTSAGVLGARGTTTLYNGWVDNDLRSGFRLASGYWFNPEKTLGVEAGFMIVQSRTSSFSANSTDGTILARPYTDATTGLPQAVLVAFPGSSNGSINATVQSGTFYSANIGLAETAYDVGWFRLTSLLGYRYYRYDEAIRINQVITPTSTNIFPFPAGTQLTNNDNFSTRNVFHGVDMGFRSNFYWDAFSLEVLTRIAFGRITRSFSTDGEQIVTSPGVTPVTQPGGVLALGPNSGNTSTGDWKAMPEAGLTLNWQITNNVSARFGYSFILLNGVSRAADQIDTTVNPNLFPGNSGAGIARPAANHIRSDMWIQALNVGVQFVY